MNQPLKNLRPISEIWSLQRPNGRYNDWGERKWIAVPPEKQEAVAKELNSLNLSPRARDLFRAARLTESKGLEIVLFSDAQLPGPIVLEKEGLLVPCFLPLNPLNPQTEERQAAMMKRGLFIYDGWIPNEEWNSDKLESTISFLDSIVSLFSVVGKYYAYWAPKYNYEKPPSTSQLFYEHDLQALVNSLNILDSLSEDDRAAVSRSVAWLSNALGNDPVQKFLLLFVSIESLATYIESSKTRADSVLKKSFATDRLPKTEINRQRDDCIKKIQSGTKNLAERIEKVYFECVQRSIRKTLEDHLTKIFGDQSVQAIMFEEQVGGKTLWLLRNDIAHGSLNLLKEAEKRFIEERVDQLEAIARNYLRRIFTGLIQINYFPAPRRPILTLPASQAIGATGTEYQGPIDMAEYYLNIEWLSSSFVQVKL